MNINELNEQRAARQWSVFTWCVRAFGPSVASDKDVRRRRFLEEALELVQATGGCRKETIELMDYVFGREVGEPGQEIGGTMVTLLSLAEVHGLSVEQEETKEIARVLAKPIEHFQAREKAKVEQGL